MFADPISSIKYNTTSLVDYFVKENEKLELLFLLNESFNYKIQISKL